MNDRTIALDVDDLCADTVPRWLYEYNRASGDCLTPDKILTYDIERYVLPLWRNKIFDIYLDMSYHTVQPVPGSLEGIDELRCDGWDVMFVTSPLSMNDSPMRKYRWLAGNGATRSLDEFAVIRRKFRIDACILVDDNPSNVATFRQKGFLFDRDWNRTISTLDRCCGWDAVLEKVRSYDFRRSAQNLRSH